MSLQMKNSRLRWIGHVLRMAMDRLPKFALKWTPCNWEEEKRPSKNQPEENSDERAGGDGPNVGRSAD